jgi:hypothetical protein
MESSNLPDSLKDLPESLRLAIEQMIDNRVEEKWKNLVEQHSDIFNKGVKTSIAVGIKRIPGQNNETPGRTTKPTVNGEHDDSTSGKRPGTGSVSGFKKPT